MFRLLGSLEIDGAARPIPLKAARQRIVLVTLLMAADHVVTVDRLIDAVWDGQSPETARGQIQICISALRRALGVPGLIETRPSGYVIRVKVEQLDYARFDLGLARAKAAAAAGRPEQALAELDAALALWRGPALAGVPGRMTEAMARQLEERRIMALEDRVEIRLELGAHRDLVDELFALTAQYPLRERLCAFLMVALYRSGRQAEALSVYQAARRELNRELGLQPGEDLRRLEHAILAHDPSIEGPGETAAGPWRPSAAQPPPQQLPADIPDFVGHHAVVESLRAALVGAEPDPGGAAAPGAVPVAVLTGRPGCGKTTVAVHAAHAARTGLPDGQLFADLHGSTARPAATTEVLARFLRSLGVSAEEIPPDLDERVNLLRSHLAGRRILIVLDDAADEEQIRPLIPGGPGPAVLVTSRARLVALPGSQVVELDAMADEDGIGLLERIAGPARVAAEPEATGELARLCGGLPLALRIAGVRLAAHPHWSVATLVDLLSDESGQLDELAHGGVGVRALLSVVHESLSPRAKRLFVLLSAVELHDFTALTAAALLEAGSARAARALDELVGVHLLNVSGLTVGKSPRYRFPSLVGVFAAERLKEQEEQDAASVAAAVDRALHALLTVSQEAYRRIYGGDYTRLRGRSPEWPGAREFFDSRLRDPLAWFDDERAGLRAAVLQAADLGLDELSWELAINAVAGYEARGQFDDWRATHLAALAAARAAGNRRGEAALLASLGSLGIAQHSKEDVEMLIGALELFEAVDDTLGQALCLRNLAHLDRIQGRPDRAVERYRRALDGFRRTGDLGAQAHVLSGLARAHLDLGVPAEAEALTKESLAIGQQLGNRRLQAQALCRLGEVFTRTGQLIAAKAVLHQALDLIRVLGDQVGEAYALTELGSADLQLGELDAAEIQLTQAMEVCKLVNERNTYANAALGLGRVFAVRREYEIAESFCLRAAQAFAAQENLPMHEQAMEVARAVREAAGQMSFTPLGALPGAQ
ncbi:MAG TPA: BTAD domain-containing putative transcriptional regulator [Actinocrinis sp.]|nr:BTAD domain-containing putative transcriptional regulator [Actinocrinis sp.]